MVKKLTKKEQKKLRELVNLRKYWKTLATKARNDNWIYDAEEYDKRASKVDKQIKKIKK